MMTEAYKPKIERMDATSYRVFSEGNLERCYITGVHSCTCIDFRYRGRLRDCKHQKALKAWLVGQEIKASCKIHLHRIRCIECNFKSTIERCDCDEPEKEEFVCYECKGVHPVEEWKGVSDKNED